MTKKLAYILTAVLVCVTVAGIVIGSVVLNRQNSFQKDITLSGDSATQEEMKVDLSGIAPGDSVEYTVNFNGDSAQGYDLNLVFRKGSDVALAKYLDLELELNGTNIQEKSLEEYMDGEPVKLELEGSENTLVFRYEMPESVGNEAQEKVADFTVEIVANPKE